MPPPDPREPRKLDAIWYVVWGLALISVAGFTASFFFSK